MLAALLKDLCVVPNTHVGQLTSPATPAPGDLISGFHGHLESHAYAPCPIPCVHIQIKQFFNESESVPWNLGYHGLCLPESVTTAALQNCPHPLQLERRSLLVLFFYLLGFFFPPPPRSAFLSASQSPVLPCLWSLRISCNLLAWNLSGNTSLKSGSPTLAGSLTTRFYSSLLSDAVHLLLWGACLCLCMAHACHGARVEAKRQRERISPLPHHVDPRGQTQVIRLSSRARYLLSCITSRFCTFPTHTWALRLSVCHGEVTISTLTPPPLSNFPFSVDDTTLRR